METEPILWEDVADQISKIKQRVNEISTLCHEEIEVYEREHPVPEIFRKFPFWPWPFSNKQKRFDEAYLEYRRVQGRKIEAIREKYSASPEMQRWREMYVQLSPFFVKDDDTAPRGTPFHYDGQ